MVFQWYFNGKKSKFSHLLTVRAEVADPPPPLTVSLTAKNPPFFNAPRKNGYFTVRLTVGGGAATSALTVSECEHFDFFLIEIGFFDTQNTFYLIVNGLKNAFSCPCRGCQNEGPASCK